MTSTDIIKYFTAEKNESLIFLVVGMLSLIIAFYGMFSIKREFYKGLFYPLLIIGLIQVGVGGRIYQKTPGDMERALHQLEKEPDLLKTQELSRMGTVSGNFTFYRYVEIALAIVGILCWISFSKGSFWSGLGVGLTIQSLILLWGDFMAMARAEIYLDLLKQFATGAAIG